MGFLDDLLTGSPPELQTRSLSTISPEQRAALDALIAQLQGRTPAAFGGQQSAPLSPFERASLTALEERSRMLASPDATLGAAGGAVRSLTDFEGQTGDANEFFRTNVQDPLLQSFGREILPQISRQFGGADFFSTERQAAEGLAREDLLESLAGQKSAVELDQFNRARDRAIQASSLAPGLSAAENARTQSQMDILRAAGIEREVEQGGLDRQYAEFVRQQQAQTQQEGLLAQLGLTPTIENIGMTDPGNAGIINLLLGGAAGGIGDVLGERGGNWLSDWLSRVFGNQGPEGENPSGNSPADNLPPEGGTGSTVTDVPIPLPTGTTPPLPTTPGGSVTITDPTTGQVIPSQPSIPGGFNTPGGGMAGGLAGGVGAGLLSGAGGAATPGGSVVISDVLGNVVGGGSVAGSAGAGAAGGATAPGGGITTSAGGGAGAGAGALGAGAGAAAALGIFAIPLALAAIGMAGDKNERMNRFMTESGITPINTQNQGILYMLNDGSFIQEQYLEPLFQFSKQWGTPEGLRAYQDFLDRIPRVQHNIPAFAGAGRPFSFEDAPQPDFYGPRRNLQ